MAATSDVSKYEHYNLKTPIQLIATIDKNRIITTVTVTVISTVIDTITFAALSVLLIAAKQSHSTPMLFPRPFIHNPDSVGGAGWKMSIILHSLDITKPKDIWSSNHIHFLHAHRAVFEPQRREWYQSIANSKALRMRCSSLHDVRYMMVQRVREYFGSAANRRNMHCSQRGLRWRERVSLPYEFVAKIRCIGPASRSQASMVREQNAENTKF